MRTLNDRTLVIGIGGSAGTVERLQTLLETVGDASPLAIVVLQTGSTDSQESLIDLIRSVTPLPVVEIDHSTPLESGVVYISPPQCQLSIDKGIISIEKAESWASEERFRATFENAAVGIAHVRLDGSWERVNDRLCEIVGYSRSEFRTPMTAVLGSIRDACGFEPAAGF
jgi:PAS domain-containing protein